MKSDEQLVVCYCETSQGEALDELMERYLVKVRAMIYPMVLDRALADDLTQEVFLRALRGLPTFRGDSRFSTWLYRVTMNTVHGYLARRARSPVAFGVVVPDPPGPDESPDGHAMRAELDAAVEGALAELSPTLRAAIVLTTIQGLGVREAARIEGCSMATMYWRIHAARKELKKRLQPHLTP